MSDKKLAVLGIVAAAMLVIAIGVGRLNRTAERSTAAGASLIQGLDPGMIDSIVLGTGDDAAVLQRAGGQFVAEDKGGYPASNEQVNRLFTSCLDMVTDQLVTRNAVNHEDLGVTEEKARYVVSFRDAAGETMAGLVIGSQAEGVRGTYVRLLGDDAVYLSANTPYLRMSSMDYLDKQLLRVEAKQVRRVAVNGPEGGYVLVSEDGGSAKLEQVPEGATEKADEVRKVLEALTSLDFSGVQPAAEAGELSFEYGYVSRRADSTEYTLEIAKADDKYYVKCRSEFMDKTPVVKDPGTESEEELAKKDAILLARQAARDFTAQHEGWVYEVASWQAEKLVKAVGDLVEVPEPEEEEEAEGAAAEE